jgi:glycosyltransferase A (GT-A) superfamily protein (DUF2064 family)
VSTRQEYRPVPAHGRAGRTGGRHEDRADQNHDSPGPLGAAESGSGRGPRPHPCASGTQPGLGAVESGHRIPAAAPGPSGTLLVIAKAPVAGRVKTRLTPAYSAEEAARLAEAALVDTLAAVLATPVRRRVLVLDGAPGRWLTSGIEVVPQCAGGLDERLAHAFGLCEGPTLLIGMDTPQVTPELLVAGLELSEGEAAFGPADDGGFWALGLAGPDPALLRGVPMSAPETGAVQRRRLTRAGLSLRDLPLLRDVDTPEDARLVAAGAPHTRFAATLAALTRAGAR